MKFYEKIIGIDKASSHDEMTITFNNGVFEFSQGALSLDGSHGPAINFRNSEVTLSDLDDHTLFFSGNSKNINFDFYFGRILASGWNLGLLESRLGSIYTTGINSSGTATLANATIANATVTDATLTTANITTAIIDNIYTDKIDADRVDAGELRIGAQPVVIAADLSINNLTLPVLSHLEKEGGWGFFHNDVDFAVPTTSPSLYYRIGFRSGNFEIPSNALSYTLTYATPLASNTFVSVTPHDEISEISGDPIRWWISASTANSFRITFSERTLGATNWRYFSYGIDTFNTVA